MGTCYEEMKAHRKHDLEHSIIELENLAELHKDATHFLSQEAYKLGIKFAIRTIENMEMLLLKAQKELPFSNPKEAKREYENQVRIIKSIKHKLINRYEGEP